MADEGAGPGHRHGCGFWRRDVRHVLVDLQLAPGHAAELLRAAAVCGRVRVAQARSAVARRRRGRHPGCLGRGGARGGQRHARSRRDGRTGDRPSGLDSRYPPAEGRRSLRPPRALDRARQERRSAGQRGVRHCPRAGARRSRARRHQRAAAPAHHCRRGAFARVHLQHPTGRVDSRRSPVRHLLDGAGSPRLGVRHGGRVQRSGNRSRAGDVERSRRGAARPPARAVWRPRRHPARAAALALDRRERARPAAKFRVPAPAHLSHRGGLHPQRGPHPRARAAAAADCRAQGAGLQQPRARVALPEVGARHRRHGCGDRSARRRRAGQHAHRSVQPGTSAFPSCSSACRPESSPARRR